MADPFRPGPGQSDEDDKPVEGPDSGTADDLLTAKAPADSAEFALGSTRDPLLDRDLWLGDLGAGSASNIVPGSPPFAAHEPVPDPIEAAGAVAPLDVVLAAESSAPQLDPTADFADEPPAEPEQNLDTDAELDDQIE